MPGRSRSGVAFVLATLSLSLASACAESGGVELLDGSILRGDSGVRPIPTRDSGPPPNDANVRDASAPFTCTTAGPYTPIEEVSCTVETIECLNACSEADCQQACFDAAPDCYTCVYVNVYACGQAMGCQGAWDAYVCCAELNGCFEATADASCVTTSCASQESIARECFDATYAECTSAYASCFPT